jgi:hypothetical protein
MKFKRMEAMHRISILVFLSVIAVHERCISPFKTYWTDITIDSIGTIARGDTCTIKGNFTGSQPIDSIGFSVNDSMGNPVANNLIEVLFLPCKGRYVIDFQKDLSLRIVPKSGAWAGDYWLVIEVISMAHKFERMKQFFIGLP